jgi:hypothetical protein
MSSHSIKSISFLFPPIIILSSHFQPHLIMYHIRSLLWSAFLYSSVVMLSRALSSIVVKALWYKPEGCGLDTQSGEWIFSFRPHQALGFTQSVTEISTISGKIMFLGSRAWPVHKADNLTTICEPVLDTVGSLTSHNTIGVHGLLRG